jgi:hypothetical protein
MTASQMEIQNWLPKILADSSTPASARLRAADMVVTHSAKAIEIEDIEARVAELERHAEVPKGGR